MIRQFINPHQHSDSSLDGAATVAQIVERNQQLGATHVAITEHGHLNTAMTLYTECLQRDMKPILGIEVYIKPPCEQYVRQKTELRFQHEPDSEKKTKKIERIVRESYAHLTIHFKDETAYQYFCQLTPAMERRAIVRYGDRKPVCTFEELKAIGPHIVIGSGCLLSLINYWLITDRNAGCYDEHMAETYYRALRSIVNPGDFYTEIFPHRITKNWKSPVIKYEDELGNRLSCPKIVEPGQEVLIPPSESCPDGDIQGRANRFILRMARKYDDPILISLDSHFATPGQKVIQDAKLGKGEGRWKNINSYHIWSTQECIPILQETLGVDEAEILRWVDNSYVFAAKFDNFKITTCDDRWVIGTPPDDFLLKLKQQIDKNGLMDWSDPTMVARLQKEIQILFFNDKINLYDYFYKVQKIADYCFNNNILLNVRGSAGGCLLLYLLRVSAVNPLKYELSFERFLTEGRIKANTLPDVDIDVSHQAELFRFLEQEYGDAFCRISTEQKLKLKSSIKDAERFLFGKVRPATETLTKKLPPTPQGVDDQAFVFGYEDGSGHVPGIFDTNTELQKYAQKNPEIWNIVKEMMGVQRQRGTHACGFVIADKPVQCYCPITYNDDQKVTGYTPSAVEQAGLIKFDGLGVNTLKDIQKCIESIYERTGKKLDPWHLPHDEKCFIEFTKGNTETVFQFDSMTVRPLLARIAPTSIEDLAATTALGRPGTLDAPYGDGRTLARVFTDRRCGEPIHYIHPSLEPILEKTMGIQLYQEQTIQIFKTFAGYSDEQAELVRRGIGKKHKEDLEACLQDLRTGCLSKGWNEEQIQLLIQQILASARYSFNKSHAVSYACVAYCCMYLKTNFPLDWWKATLSNAKKEEVAKKFWKFVKPLVKMPDINISTDDYYIRGDSLVAPLSIIKGVGQKSFESLIENKPYRDLEHFVQIHFQLTGSETPRTPIHSGIVKKMIAAGVLDSLFTDTPLLEDKISQFNQIKAKIKGGKAEPLPSSLLSITAFDQYMFKKQVLSIYSDDLRELVLPFIPRAEKRVESDQSHYWCLNNHVVHCWNKLQILKEYSCSPDFYGDYYFLGFVIDERVFRYGANNCKQATELTLDINGYFYEEVCWPPYTDSKTEESVAQSGFSGLPVLLCYNVSVRGCRLANICPVISKDALKKYSLL